MMTLSSCSKHSDLSARNMCITLESSMYFLFFQTLVFRNLKQLKPCDEGHNAVSRLTHKRHLALPDQSSERHPTSL